MTRRPGRRGLTTQWKDYDSYPGSHPSAWTGQFELSRWTILAAYDRTHRVGGAVVIVDDPKSTCFAIVRRVRFSGNFAWRRMHAARALAPRSSKLPNGAPAIAVLAAFVSKRRTSMCQHVDSTTPKGFAWSERHREPTRSCRTRFSCSGTSRCVERSTRHSLGTWRRTRVSRFRLMPPATTDQSWPADQAQCTVSKLGLPGFSEDQQEQERPVGPSCSHFPTAIVRRSSTARRSRMSRSSPSRSSPGEASCRPAGTSRSRTSALHPHCSRR